MPLTTLMKSERMRLFWRLKVILVDKLKGNGFTSKRFFFFFLIDSLIIMVYKEFES